MAETVTAAFVTAEDCQEWRRRTFGGWVLLTTFSDVVDGTARPVRFEVTTSTGYRATLPACLSGYCERERKPCTRALDNRRMHSGMSVDKWLKHIRTDCHEWHLAQAERFRDRVLKTYTDPLKLR